MRRIESKPTHLHPQAQTVNRSHRQYPLTLTHLAIVSVSLNDSDSEGAKHLRTCSKSTRRSRASSKLPNLPEVHRESLCPEL